VAKRFTAEVEMVVQECPCVDLQGFEIAQVSRASKKIFSIDFVAKYLCPFYPPSHHVAEGARGIQSWLSCHESELTGSTLHSQVAMEPTSPFHVSTKVLSEFPEVLDRVSYELGAKQNQFLISQQTKVKEPMSTILSFNRQFQLGKEEQEAVDWGWGFEPGDTMFNIVNAYTRGAQFNGLSAESSHRLQTVGGNILGMLEEK
jgi:hypothetical protein